MLFNLLNNFLKIINYFIEYHYIYTVISSFSLLHYIINLSDLHCECIFQ